MNIIKSYVEEATLFISATFPISFISYKHKQSLINNNVIRLGNSKRNTEKLLSSAIALLIISGFFYLANIGPYYTTNNIEEFSLITKGQTLSEQITSIATTAPKVTLWLEVIKLLSAIIFSIYLLYTFVEDIAMSLSGSPNALASHRTHSGLLSNLKLTIVVVLGVYIIRLLTFNVVHVIGIRAANNLHFSEFGSMLLPSDTNIENFKSSSDIFIYALNFPFTSPELLITENNWIILCLLFLSFLKLVLVTLLLSVFLFILPSLKSNLWNGPKILEKFIGKAYIILYKIKDKSKIDNGFLSSSRAISYLHTQDLVVPKKELYKNYEHLLLNKFVKNRIKIFSPGDGNLSFLKHLIENKKLISKRSVNYFGADLSEKMIEIGIGEIPKKSDHAINIKLFSGVNLVLSNNEMTKDLKNNGTVFDAILSTQFDHYFPNNKSSILYGKLNQKDITPLTKMENYKFYHSILSTNGILVIFDDFIDDCPQENDRLENLWDTYVANNFTNTTTMEELKNKSELMFEKVQELYPAKEKIEITIDKVKNRRIKRRKHCLEETRTLNQTISELKEIFGEDSIEVNKNIINDLPNFSMIIAHKKPAN